MDFLFLFFFVVIFYFFFMLKNIIEYWKKPQEPSTLLYRMLNFFERHTETIFFLFLTNIFAIFLVYNRVFAIKLPKNLQEFHVILLFVGIIIIITQCVIIIITIKQIFSSKNDKSNLIIKKYKKIFKRFRRKHFNKNDLKFISNLPGTLNIKKRIEDTYMKVLYYLLNYPFFDYLCFSICFNFRKKFTLKSVIYMHFFFFYLPKILFTLILFVDVFYFLHLNMFYKFLWLLLIPLIGKILRFTCKMSYLPQYKMAEYSIWNK